MNLKVVYDRMKAIRWGAMAVALVLAVSSVQAQQEEHRNANVRLGQKALLAGDFKGAVTHLEKAFPAEASDPDVLYLLGYSQFQSGDFQKAADSFGRVVTLDPKNANAFYYKAKAYNTLAVAPDTKLTDAQKEQFMQQAIADYSKAILVNANDAKLYQNRAIAYRDLGILKGTKGNTVYDKQVATDAYNRALKDYEKVLTYDAARKDIQTEMKKARVYRDNL